MGEKRELAASSGRRLATYLEHLARSLHHADRVEPLRAYVHGLLLPGERKSVEPMAARVDPRNVPARHQSMHHFVANAPWSERSLLRAARDWVLPAFEAHGGVEAWVLDDTGIPKKGAHSVGVARQYCGILGKQDNCQVAVSISVVNESLSLPVAYRLYLPEDWASDPVRRRKVRVPKEVVFQKKWEIALSEIDALAGQLPPAPIVMDAGYGNVTAFRTALAERERIYVAAIQKEVGVWLEGKAPSPPKRRGAIGRPRKLLGRDAQHPPTSVFDLASSLPESAWRTVSWRQGTRGSLRSRFARMRVHPSHRDYWRTEPHPEEWLLVEWPRDADAPTHYWLTNLPRHTSMKQLVHFTKLRWRIERDYQELKSELGLDPYEGRGWRGFHHHAALCIAAYAFLLAERARLSPPEPRAFVHAPPVPKRFRPRGSPGPDLSA